MTRTDPHLVTELRAMRRAGCRSVDMLRFLDRRGLATVDLMDHFRAAFHLDSYDVAPIGGWFADGTGELDDDAVTKLLDSSIAAHEP